MIVAIAKPDHSSGGNVHHLAQKRVEGGGGRPPSFTGLTGRLCGIRALVTWHSWSILVPAAQDTRPSGLSAQVQSAGRRGMGEGGREVNLVLVFTAGK